MIRLNRISCFAAAALLGALPLAAQRVQTTTPAEARTVRAFEAARKAGAPELHAFLKPFPKGADLHMHFSGAVYAETFIAEAAKQGLWIGSANSGIPAGPMSPGTLCFQSAPDIKPVTNRACGPALMPVADSMQLQTTYDALINSFSLRSFVPSPGWSGHDQFFATFDRFSGLKNVQGEWLYEVATRAASQNEQYLEIMHTPSFNHVFPAIEKNPWPADFSDANHIRVLAKYRDQLLANGLREDIPIDANEFADAKQTACKTTTNEAFERSIRRSQVYRAGERVPKEVQAEWNASKIEISAECSLTMRFLYQVLRGFPPAQVFAQTLLGFELASAHPEQVVGINFVRAEDRRDAMAEYHTEMLMLDYLHSVYPKVRISLHAGELAPGIVPPDGLSFHIREALDLGHAERIGHGVDVLYEDRPDDLLKQMAAQHTMVEINLTSNDGILGIKGSDHPLAAYRAAHVPWALSTDDEGVSRGNLTQEYVRGVLEQGLSYADLKQSARTSLEHSFLPGESLWVAPDVFTRRKSACAGAITAASIPGTACTGLLKNSERAAQQWELERRIAAFEAVPH